MEVCRLSKQLSISTVHTSGRVLAADPDLEDVLMIMHHARCDCGVIGAQDSSLMVRLEEGDSNIRLAGTRAVSTLLMHSHFFLSH